MSCTTCENFSAVRVFAFSRAEIEKNALSAKNPEASLSGIEPAPFLARTVSRCITSIETIGLRDGYHMYDRHHPPPGITSPSDELSTIFRDHPSTYSTVKNMRCIPPPKSTSPPGYQFLGPENSSPRGGIRRVAWYSFKGNCPCNPLSFDRESKSKARAMRC